MTNITNDKYYITYIQQNIKANIFSDILKNIFCKDGELLRFATAATQNHMHHICRFLCRMEIVM